jgi:hypothetical protein
MVLFHPPEREYKSFIQQVTVGESSILFLSSTFGGLLPLEPAPQFWFLVQQLRRH